MKNNSTFLFLVALGALMILFSTCQKEEDIPSQYAEDDYIKIGNLLVHTNPALESARRTRFHDELVPVRRGVERELKSTSDFPDVDLTKNYVFKLKGEVASPVFDGHTLQATHVVIDNAIAYVTYNTQGAQWLGGFEIFDVSDINNPTLITSVILPDADISSVSYLNDKLYITGAMGDFESLGLETPAFCEVISLDDTKTVLAVDTILDVSSYVGTDIKATEDNIFVTSGSTGHLTIFKNDYSRSGEFELTDARSLAVSKDTAFVLQGQSARVQLVNTNDNTLLDLYEMIGADIPGSKTEIALNGKYIFATLNEKGLKVLHKTGELKQHIAAPVPENGAPAENYVTNSVSLNDALVLIGNGAAGVHVGAMVEENDDGITMLGSMQFNGAASTNFVESKDSVIFVATGKEGLKILSIGIDEGVPDDVIPTEPCESLLGDISELFPEGEDIRKMHAKLFSDIEQLNIHIKKETNIYLTFLDEGAGWKNTFGYYTYQKGNPPKDKSKIEHHIVFPNVSKTGEGGGLAYGDMVQLGDKPFPAGTVIGFYLVAEGWKTGETVSGKYTHYTNPELNINKAQQSTLFLSKGCNEIVLTFEDIKLSHSECDFDFNDIILAVKDNPGADVPNTRIELSGLPVLQATGDK